MADELQKIAPAVDIYVNGTLTRFLQVLEIGRSQGGRSLDYAEMMLAPHPTMPAGSNVKNVKLIDDLRQHECVIQLRDESGSLRTVHWGFTDCKSLNIDSSEHQVITSRLQPYHFGDPILGMRVWSPFTNRPAESLEQIVFNPCHYLCWTGNAAQTHIANPTLFELGTVLSLDRDILRNHAQPFGEYLPANLDALLEPYGYSWKIDLAGAKPKIVVFKRGAGLAVRANLAVPGAWADLRTSNVEEINVTTDVANHLANNIQVYGDTFMVEYTMELVPAWLPDYDSYHTTAANAAKLALHGGDDKAWETTPALARVWRDWVLNEAGDYTAKRRKLLPCITLGTDFRPIGEHHGVVVEYYRWDRNPTSTTTYLETGTWQPVEHLSSADSIGIQVLDKECGIRFSGLHYPVELANYGAVGQHPARIRVTATVEMDRRVATAQSALASANIHPVWRTIDVGSRFKVRYVHNTSKFFGNPQAIPGQVDDHAKSSKLANELLANWNQASVSGTVALPGVDWAIANDCVGKSFGGIVGRGIDFQTTQGAPKKYPSITAMKLDFVNQKTILSLDTWKRDQ
jgi:hypothetical protein